MSKKAIVLTRVDFDGLENSITQARCQEILGVFIGEGEMSAHGVMAKWFNDQKPVHAYLGWDGEVYPKYVLKEIELI